VLCQFANVLDSGEILLRTTLITYLGEVCMIGRGTNLAQSGRVSPPDNLKRTRHDLKDFQTTILAAQTWSLRRG